MIVCIDFCCCKQLIQQLTNKVVRFFLNNVDIYLFTALTKMYLKWTDKAVYFKEVLYGNST